jgi:hypothetical protein
MITAVEPRLAGVAAMKEKLVTGNNAPFLHLESSPDGESKYVYRKPAPYE